MIGGVSLYFARIRFDIVNKAFINYEEKSYLLFSNDMYACKLVGCNDHIKSSDQLWLEYGGFPTYDEAYSNSVPLVDELKLYCAKRGIAIKIAGGSGETDSTEISTTTGGITERGKMLFGFPPNSEFEVMGLGIYKVENGLCEIPFISGHCSPSSLINDFKIDYSSHNNYDEKARIAISLLNSSNVLTRDSRVSFLLKIMAVEALVPADEKYGAKIIEKIQEVQNNKEIISQIDEILKDTNINIKEVLGKLKNKSIGIKTRELVYRLCSDRIYFEIAAIDFWKQCYDIRSKFAHNGKIALKSVNDRQSVLHELVTDLIEAYIIQINL